MAAEQWTAKWKQVRTLSEVSGQGKTYEVELITNPSQRGVLKLLHRDKDDQARRRMATECINMQNLNKKGVKVPGWIDDNTSAHNDLSVELYLVMEFIPGETLDKVLMTHGPHSLDQSIALIRDLCQTMAGMHLCEVLHRDIKPANLMVRDFGRADIVVLDLGLSFDLGNQQESVTETGEPIRNELFVQPNLTKEELRSPRMDVLNIVGVFFFCLTGKLPVHLRDQQMRAPHRRPGAVMKELLQGDERWIPLDLLFDRGFEQHIDDRFQTIEEFQERLAIVESRTTTQRKSAVELDRERGPRLRQRNRKLQIEEYNEKLGNFSGHIARAVKTISDQLGTFVVAITGDGMQPLPLPSGIDPLSITHAISVGVRAHKQRRIVRLLVGARGSQCVLLRTDSVGNVSGRSAPSQWIEVTYFDPNNPPDQPTVLGLVDGIVGALIEEIDADLAQISSARHLKCVKPLSPTPDRATSTAGSE